MPQIIPVLRITNYRVSRTYYTELLGFQVDWEALLDPEMAVCMQVSRDGMALHLTEHADDCEVGGLVRVLVPDVDAWYADLRRKRDAGQATSTHRDRGIPDHDPGGPGRQPVPDLHEHVLMADTCIGESP